MSQVGSTGNRDARLKGTDIRNGIKRTRRAFLERDIIYFVASEEFFVQRPRGIWNDLVDPSTMADDFTALYVRAEGEEVMLAALGVRKHADNENSLWE